MHSSKFGTQILRTRTRAVTDFGGKRRCRYLLSFSCFRRPESSLRIDKTGDSIHLPYGIGLLLSYACHLNSECKYVSMLLCNRCNNFMETCPRGYLGMSCKPGMPDVRQRDQTSNNLLSASASHHRGELIGGAGARPRKSYMFMAHLHRGVVTVDSRTFPCLLIQE